MGDGKRTKPVLVRLTEEEDALLKEEARAQGRELAQHLRWLALEGRKLMAQQTERRPRSAALTPADLAAIRDAIREVATERPPETEDRSQRQHRDR